MAAAESTMMRQQQNIQLDDLGENGGGGIDSLPPPRVLVGSDENGVRKVIQYCFDDEGNKFEVVTTIAPVGKLARAPTTRSSIKPNPMPSSADTMEDDDAKSRLINLSTKGALPERPRFSASLISGNKAQQRGVPMVPMERLICHSKGHHWTIKCPSRAQATVGMSRIADGPSPPRKAVKRPYPVRRADRIRDDVKRIMNDDRCVRVTNLSKEARKDRLVGLFCIFGFVTHVYILVDENGSNRGVGYVKFAHRREAESAVEMVNGWVYENLAALQVGWAAPRRLN